MADLRIEQAGEAPAAYCECCGRETKTVWGYVYDADRPTAAYFVQWTKDAPTHSPNFDFLIGSWGAERPEADRVLVSFSYRPARGGGAFSAIDASSRPAARSPLCRKALSREEVVGDPGLMALSRGILDAIWLGDPRIQEVRRFDQDA